MAAEISSGKTTEKAGGEIPEADTGKASVRISVRNLVEFVMRGGDLDNRRMGAAQKDAMQAGSRIHRKIQRRMGAAYQAEVSMRHVADEGDFQIVIEGRADGVITEPAGVTID